MKYKETILFDASAPSLINDTEYLELISYHFSWCGQTAFRGIKGLQMFPLDSAFLLCVWHTIPSSSNKARHPSRPVILHSHMASAMVIWYYHRENRKGLIFAGLFSHERALCTQAVPSGPSCKKLGQVFIVRPHNQQSGSQSKHWFEIRTNKIREVGPTDQ